MFRKLASVCLSIAPLTLMALPAAAHDYEFRSYRPYVIEKTCDDDYTNCMARMVYAPGQNPGLAGYGSYWFQRATRAVRVVNETHVAWCLSHYKTYDPRSNTFIGKGFRSYRCNSPYDGI
jgi:BA14K-like protein